MKSNLWKIKNNLKYVLKFIFSLRFFILILILSTIIYLIIEITNLLVYYAFISENLYEYIYNVIPEGNPTNDKVAMDPARYWPSGVPQSATIIGSMLGVYKVLSTIGSVNPRLRVLASLSAGGIAAGNITYHSALENSVGFNRLMFGMTEYRRTGRYPSIENLEKQDTDTVNRIAAEELKKADDTTVNSVVKEAIEKNSTTSSDNGVSNYLPDLDLDLNYFSNKLIDYMFNFIFSIIKPVNVTGYFDDLIGQHIAIEVILLYMLIFTSILFIIYFINVLLYINKDYILNTFDNKYIKFYIKYQAFLIKISLIVFPIFILISLFTLIHGIIYLLSHTIPYEQLGVDLHVLVSYDSNPSHHSCESFGGVNNIDTVIEDNK